MLSKVSLLLLSLEENCKLEYKWHYWTCKHPSVCECAATLSDKRHPAPNREPAQVKKETDCDIGKQSPLSTGCQAEADTAMVDMAVAVAEDVVMAEANAAEAMKP